MCNEPLKNTQGGTSAPAASLRFGSRWTLPVLTLLVVFALPAHRVFGQINNQTNFSNDFSLVTNFADTPVTQQQNNFSTMIEAVLNGKQTLYSQTFSLPFSDATVQQAVAAAESVLTQAGGMNLTGPTLVSNTTVLQGSAMNTIETGRTAIAGTVAQDIITTNIGPLTLHQMQFPTFPSVFAPGASVDPAMLLTLAERPNVLNNITLIRTNQLAGGQVDINVDQPIFLTIHRNIVTTNTNLTTQVYQINAVTSGGGIPVVPLPPAAWQALIGLGLMGAIYLRSRWRAGALA